MMVMGGLGGIIFALAPLPLVESIVRGNDILWTAEIFSQPAPEGWESVGLTPLLMTRFFRSRWMVLRLCGWQRIRRENFVLHDRLPDGGRRTGLLHTHLAVRHPYSRGRHSDCRCISMPPHGPAETVSYFDRSDGWCGPIHSGWNLLINYQHVPDGGIPAYIL